VNEVNPESRLNQLQAMAFSGTVGGGAYQRILRLVLLVNPHDAANLALRVRKAGYRQQALMICNALARIHQLRGETLAAVCVRGDDITDFMGYYWQSGKHAISKQVKVGLARAIENLPLEQLPQYDHHRPDISLRDVMFLVHPRPRNSEQEEYWRKFLNHQLPEQEAA
jgi:hypothetical protein